MDGDELGTKTVYEQLQEHFAKGNPLPESWGAPSDKTQEVIEAGGIAGGVPAPTMEGGKRVHPEWR